MWKGPRPAGLYLGSLFWAGFVNVGIVLQVLQTTNNSTVTITGAGIPSSITPTSTMGTQLLSQAITPASTFNRVLAIAQATLVSTAGAGAGSMVLLRGTTVLQSNGWVTVAATTGVTPTILFLDSPGSTTAQTYSVRVGQDSTGASTVVLPNIRSYANTSLCTLTVAELTS